MPSPTSAEIAALFDNALDMAGAARPRTIQQAQGLIGMSTLGWCRQKALLMVKGVQPSDTKSTRAADLGTALHAVVGEAIETAYPSWIVEGGGQKVVLHLPSGAEVPGTPDYIDQARNAVYDLKTVDGLSYVKRYGPDQQKRFQRAGYAIAAVQAGLLDRSKPVYAANVYLDRSGREKGVYVDEIEEIDIESYLDQIDNWITDVIYARLHEEDASRDIDAPVCAQICEFFTVCRGALPDSDPDLIADEEGLNAVQMYVEARDAKKAAERQMDEAKAMLADRSGLAGGYQVRWTTINGADIPGYYREGTKRLDVTKARRR